MRCIFIGGPLDGELREVRQLACGDWAADNQPWEDYRTYHIANGIARHESLSEDEVARMLKAWRGAWEERHLIV